MTRYERDPELVNFLSKVEDLDSKRYNNVSTSKPTREPLSPVKSHNPRECREADIITGENIEDRDNLAYRSAYNYEMTFSPKKTHYSLNELDLERITPKPDSKNRASRNEKKFVISEEDYLLLQKLKASQSCSDFNSNQNLPSFEEGPRMPSRGRPRQREKEIISIRYDFELPERADTPSTSSSPPPPLPTRRNHARINEDAAEEKPLLPTRPTKAGVTEPPPSRSKKPEVVVPERVKPAPPVPRSTKPASFLSSLEDNKLTKAKSHNSEVETPKKTIKNSHIDYLDSIQLKPTTLSPTIKNKSKPAPPSPPAKRIPRSESFIKSMLNSNLTTTSKPSLPEKPQKLWNANLAAQKSKPSIPPKRVELKVVLPELRPVETSPTKQKFEHSIDLPKLRSSSRNIKKKEKDNIPEGIKGIQNLKKTKQEKPIIPQKKPFLTDSSKDTTIKNDNDVNKSDNELEALSLRNNLKKRPPKAPQRKISMPEALRKVELMKKSKTEPVLEPSNELSINAKLDAIIASRNLRASNTLPEFNNINTNTATFDESAISRVGTTKETKPLVHPNKNRARGPRRKPPTRL
ncbi:Bsp1p [Saccharomyces paradoxus]|uniref:Bsp1p n=1 Tax=Saccharomyces paradoxus TaxID=27291 RepID=A0A8B8V1U3_SACPA|nr:Bsp1 [Saccharomyces paradoxus]QHS76879.1 Bsp1 [Saccharomyces paradoxus]